VLLGSVNVGPDEDLVELARLKFLINEPFVILAVTQDEGVGYGPLQELGGDVGQVSLFSNLKVDQSIIKF